MPETTPPIVEARGFTKTFGGKAVLRGVDLTIQPGEIRGLVGQNGSGKSTFIKILSGYHAPDPGASLRVRGELVELPLAPNRPAELGLHFVHQDLGLLETGSVLENVMVGRYQPGPLWKISWRSEAKRARRLLQPFGLDVDPFTPLTALTEVERTIVAIARAMSGLEGRAGLLVLDEPTSRLPTETVGTFFDAVREVAAQEMGVLFVSHRLDEVLSLTSRVTVLRDGVAVADRETGGLQERDLVADILGFSLEDLYPEPHHSTAETVLAIRGLVGGPVRGFSAEVHRGEVLGLTGLLGMGHDAVLHLLFGSIPATAGTLEVDGQRLALNTITPRQAMAAGLALLPSNRLRDGAVAAASAAENMTLATLGSYYLSGLLRHRREERTVGDLMRRFDVRPEAPSRPLSTFSGGNQQKALVAKWFSSQPTVMLLDEPTHGVDVGAKKQIFQHLRNAAEAGTAILVSSVEAEDLAQTCDRVLVFRYGRVVADLSGAELTEARITEQALMGGHPEEGHSAGRATLDEKGGRE